MERNEMSDKNVETSPIERLVSCEHPYYCSDANYFSNEPKQRYETATEFLDDYESADIDRNLVFRWDVEPRGETGAEAGRFCAEIFMIQQRKGIFKPIYIAHINDTEAARFEQYLAKHFETIKALWAPFTN